MQLSSRRCVGTHAGRVLEGTRYVLHAHAYFYGSKYVKMKTVLCPDGDLPFSTYPHIVPFILLQNLARKIRLGELIIMLHGYKYIQHQLYIIRIHSYDMG